MTEETPKTADVRQLRTQAKERLETLQAQDPNARLADAQREVARENGYASWPKLVAELETPVLLERLKRLVERGDAEGLDRLLRRRPSLARRLDEPMFGFDTPPLIQAARHREAARLLPVLVRHGADPNARSRWWAGGFSALDFAGPEATEALLALGARWDVWSAAAQGQADALRALLDADPGLVSAPGGDGMTPLHFAKTAEVAELLLERGADLEARDVDHESTPLQHRVNDLEVARLLVARGARPDPFVAAVLDDPDLLDRVLEEDPDAARARVGRPPYVTVKSDGGHTYVYQLGPDRTPAIVAAERGSLRALERLRGLRPVDDLLAAAWREDEPAFHRAFRGKPAFEPADHGLLAAAAQAGRVGAVRLLLEAGLEPRAPGMDSGTALHVAAWFGRAEIVRLLIPHVPLDALDAHHGSPPLGWATHGAQWCRDREGDYVAVVEALLAAGVDPNAPANRYGATMLEQAGDREDVKAVLRKAMG